MDHFEIEFDVNATVRALVYLSEAYRLDLLTLLLLYDRYENDIFYFFFMLAGRKISIPKFSKLTRIQTFAERFDRIDPVTLRSKQEQNAYRRIKELDTGRGTVKLTHNIIECHAYQEEGNIKI